MRLFTGVNLRRRKPRYSASAPAGIALTHSTYASPTSGAPTLFFATEYKHTSAFWNRKIWRRKKRKKRTFGKFSADSRPILTIHNWRRRKTTSLSVWCRCKFTLLVVYRARRRRLPCCHWRQHIAFRAERLRVYTYRQQALLAGWGHSAPHADFE